jgi:pimeloyl-ACP methyl ester carboxylesterase
VQGRIATVPLHFDALFCARWTLGDLRRLRMPTLLINGGRTRAPARDVAFLLGAALPNVRRMTIADAGHLGPMTHEAEVNTLILRHLRDCGVVPEGAPAAMA